MKRVIFVVAITFAYTSMIYGQSDLVVDRIEIEGLWRTRPVVVLRELLFEPEDVLREEAIAESTVRLRNLQLFSEVAIDVTEMENRRALVTIRVVEKWTIIPIFKAGGGGGVNFLTIGAFDVNTFGRYLELGGQYERLGQTNSGVLWFRDPRFLGRRLRVGGDFWSLARNRRLYDQDAELTGGYTHSRLRAHLFFDRELNPHLTAGGGIDLTSDSYSREDLEQDARDRSIANGLPLPDGESHISPYLTLHLGRLNFDNYLVAGNLTEIRLAYGIALDDSSENHVMGELSQRFFFLLPRFWGNIGVQGVLGQSTSNSPAFQYYIGGLDAVRGYFDGQFLSPAFWRLNLEYRVASIQTEWFVLQHVFFSDVGNIGDDLYLALSSDEHPFVGYGLGVRLISPRVHRFNVRFDYALVTGRDGPGGISFGFQHFF